MSLRLNSPNQKTTEHNSDVAQEFQNQTKQLNTFTNELELQNGRAERLAEKSSSEITASPANNDELQAHVEMMNGDVEVLEKEIVKNTSTGRTLNQQEKTVTQYALNSKFSEVVSCLHDPPDILKQHSDDMNTNKWAKRAISLYEDMTSTLAESHSLQF